jgi:polar amino acid transport system substrate-binding protein
MERISSFLFLILLTFFSCSSSSNGGRKVGVDATWSPMGFGQRDHNVTAFSTELLSQIGKTEKIPFVKISVNWDNLMEGLQKNNYEAILTSMPPYLFNEKVFDFSDVYLPLGPVLVIPIGSKIQSIDNLNGLEIAVISGSTNASLLQGSTGVLIRYYPSIPKALSDITNGTIDGAIIDVLSATSYCRDLYQSQLKIATPPLNEDGLRLVTKHNAAIDLIKGFNQGLQKLKKDGTYDKLRDKWGLIE